MRLYRSIVTASLLTTAVALANTAFADKIHGDAESLDYNGISNLLQEDPSLVNLKDAQGRTPLLCAVNSIYATCNADGLKKTIDVLLVSHADIHARDKDGNTVLHYAVRQGLDFVTLFVSSDRKLVTATNDIQQTPLHTAVQLGQIDIAEFLIVSGAHVNARDKDGITPLHIAVEKRNTDMVNLLLRYHADINARTNDGKTPYTLAENPDDSTFQRFIRKNGGHE
jgi:ankyrin repeat protein